MRITKVTTRKGDRGETGLGNGTRVAKNHPRITCLGSLDELNAQLGLVLALDLPASLGRELRSIQNDLLNLGGEIAGSKPGRVLLSPARTAFLEDRITSLNAALPPLREFVLPGGSEAGARVHFARTLCRRAERDLVTLYAGSAIPASQITYLNRLSDYLFVLARTLNREASRTEILWDRSSGKGEEGQ